MPSRFPWSKSNPSHSYNSDPALEIPRSASRQEVTYPLRQESSEAAYNPYTQAHQSTSSFDSTSPPPTANAPPSINPGTAPEQPIAGQAYETYTTYHYPHPSQSQKQHHQKKSFRNKLLGREEPEAKQDIFGRKRSIRRKEAPAAPEQIQPQRQGHAAGPWPINTQVGQHPNQPKSFEPYSPDFANEELESREYQNLPPPPPLHGEQQYGSPQSLQQGPPRPILHPSPLNPHSEGSGDIHNFPGRRSFDSLPQPPSRPDSRPISRQSYDRQTGNNPQVQSSQQEQYQAQAVQDQHQQQLQQSSPGGLMAPPPSQRHQRQNPPMDSNRLNAPSRENSYAANPSPLSNPDSNSQSSQSLTAGMIRGQQSAQEGEARSRTPPPPRAASDMTEAEVNQLIKDHREMKSKYNNVKRQYFDKRDQVDALQNTLAHQRLAQSRTQWDDGEYITRMTRLDGLISQLAFGMRKEWKAIPDWLQPHCNKDALQVGKQEMTAVGRAYVSRWLADELFDKYFHPSLPVEMSENLKWIQRNIREYAPASQSGEEEEALTAKIINWRLATADGLQPILGSSEASSNRQKLIDALSEKLVEDIKSHMEEYEPPAGLEGGVDMIIELAVAILANLPLESRDIHVNYFLPGHPIIQDLMKVETGIPPLPEAQDTSEGDQGRAQEGHGHESELAPPSTQEEAGKRGFLSGLVSGAKRTVSPSRGLALKQSEQKSGSQSSLPQTQQAGAAKEEKVRMCVFLGAQNRGKMVLVKAPVYRA